MQDQPSAAELLEALASFLEHDVVACLEGGRRFKAIVAANTARIVAREIELAPGKLADEHARLTELLGRQSESDATDLSREVGDGEGDAGEQDGKQGAYSVSRDVMELNRELCARIEAGEADQGPWRAEVLAHLRATVRDKLDIDNPTFK